MNEVKNIFSIFVNIFFFLAVGLLFTVTVLKRVYESFGIPFIGNVWVNWFGVSFILFVGITLIVELFFRKNRKYFKQLVTSPTFWLLFIVSNYIVFLPFIKGANPF